MNSAIFTISFSLALLPFLAGNETHSRDSSPIQALAQLNGTWSGIFVGYDLKGRELYRIRVKQVYRNVNQTTQKVEIEDMMPDGTTIRGVGQNTASLRPDGSLVLHCSIVKSNGDRVDHEGKVIIGPDGDEQILWITDKPDRKEAFREFVRKEGNQTVYSIHGMGQYGTTLILMSGSYHKQ
jgi:hypothetical protein